MKMGNVTADETGERDYGHNGEHRRSILSDPSPESFSPLGEIAGEQLGVHTAKSWVIHGSPSDFRDSTLKGAKMISTCVLKDQLAADENQPLAARQNHRV